MRTAALSLRDRFADPEPLALHREGDVVIAIVASAWGSWSGLDGEALTVDAAMSTLVREARGPTPLDPEALRRAFVAASERLDQHPVVDNDALDFPPVASLITVVATPSAILVGWMGSVVACIVDQASVVRSTPSHTLRRQLLEEQDVSPDLVDATLPAARHIMVRTVQPLREARPEPELAQWPPLAPGQRLLLADHALVERLQAALPLSAEGGEPWLREALSLHDDAGERVGILLEPD